MQVKRITLKKEVIAKMSVNEMGNLWGGKDDEKYIYHKEGHDGYVPPVIIPTMPDPTPPNTCGTAWTCNG